MKKFNLFLSALVLALVVLVAGGATVAPVMQARAMSFNPASNANGQLSGTELFDSKGRYAVDLNNLKDALTSGAVFQFFGHDWHVVYVNETQNVATFWMADPYAKTTFNATTRSAVGIFKDGSNVWSNGYSKTVWEDETNGKVEIEQSDLRQYLNDAAKTIIDNKDYKKYKSKVRAGYVDGSNQSNDTAYTTVENLSYSKTSVDNVMRVNQPTDQLTAYFDLDSSDRLWLPSVGDLRTWGILSTDTTTNTVLKDYMLKWTETTAGYTAWLRNGSKDNSEYALTVSAEAYANEGYAASYFHALPVKQEAGVRPAIHLDIANISAEYQDHLDNPNGKGSWWDDDWLKALFFTVCIIGVIGVVLVIVAVVVKVRHNNSDNAD